MWGQDEWVFSERDRRRIIPTRVGTSELLYCCVALAKDHPHACGDKDICSPWTQQPLGSSPRVWGQAVVEKLAPLYVGIIPTRVGTRKLLFPPFRGCRDHPHACGDKLHLDSRYLALSGSSPRVWGQGKR